MGHGLFLKWLQVEFGIPERTAYSCINAARARAEVATIANVSEEVIEAVAAPSMTEMQRKDIIQRMKAGEPFTKEKIRAEVRANKSRSARATRVSLPPQTAPSTQSGSAAGAGPDMPTPAALERAIPVLENLPLVNNDGAALAPVAEQVGPNPDLADRAYRAIDLMMMKLGTSATELCLELCKGLHFADLQAAYERYIEKLHQMKKV